MSLVRLLLGELLNTRSSPFCGAPFGDQFEPLLQLPEPAVQVRMVARALGAAENKAADIRMARLRQRFWDLTERRSFMFETWVCIRICPFLLHERNPSPESAKNLAPKREQQGK